MTDTRKDTFTTTIDLGHINTQWIENDLTHGLTATITATKDDIQIEFDHDTLTFDGDDGESRFKLLNEEWEAMVIPHNGYGESGLTERTLDFHILFDPLDKASQDILLDNHNEFAHQEDFIAGQIERTIENVINETAMYTVRADNGEGKFQNGWMVGNRNEIF